MTFIFSVRSLFILLLSFSSLLFASPFDNPYQGSVVVVQQSEDELKELALKQVLVKVSGNVQIAEIAESKLLLENTQSLLSQYGYKSYQNTRYFMAVFDKHKINQALQAMQQPIWGDTRPTTLVWLVKDSGSERQLVSDNMVNLSADSAFSWALQNEQRNRGVALQFPLMDLEDSLALSISDVSGRFYDPISTASQRYSANHFIVANLKHSSGENWSLVWELARFNPITKQNEVLLSEKGYGKKTSIVSAMVSNVADYYASQYAVIDNQGEKFSQTIYVNGINSLAQLTQLNKTLSNLLAINSFAVTSVEGSQVTLNIKINGGMTSFKNGIFAQQNLQPDPSQNDQFHFNWR
ncbi:MAG: hypothetical protein ACJAT7_000757 [Psychromonas sp.]|jgi:hypothetical protein|uniref:DUF2066 domain-containing protein n=1 Tax=Psychromonas sp. TaxID=1884585 RepID=UPI0039E608E2